MMRDYLITLMAVALLSGIVGMISPDGNVKKYIKLVSALCLLCAIVHPLFSLLSQGDFSVEDLLGEVGEEELTDYDEIYNHALLSGSEQNAEKAICAVLLQEFDLPADSLLVDAELEMKNDICRLARITLTVRDAAILVDPRELTAYVNEAYGCACTVVYD